MLKYNIKIGKSWHKLKRKDCGKEEEIGDFLSIKGYKTETMLLGGGEKRLYNYYNNNNNNNNNLPEPL
jgi:hypothetical protein